MVTQYSTCRQIFNFLFPASNGVVKNLSYSFSHFVFRLYFLQLKYKRKGNYNHNPSLCFNNSSFRNAIYILRVFCCITMFDNLWNCVIQLTAIQLKFTGNYVRFENSKQIQTSTYCNSFTTDKQYSFKQYNG